MIIPQYIQELIFKNQAQFRTFTLGTSGGTIVVPENKVCLFLGFVSENFFINPSVEDPDVNFVNYNIKVNTNGITYNYLQRMDIANFGSQKKYDAFVVTNENININIFRFEPNGEFTTVVSQIPNLTDNPEPPIMGGTTNNDGFVFDVSIKTDNKEVRPFKFTPVSESNSTHDFSANVNQNTINLFQTKNEKSSGNPMMTFYYVLINKKSMVL